jgi:alpha-tubulin suppressor-like RCC1 family protein
VTLGFPRALYTHRCALTTGGGIKCWGNNDSGELGDGSAGYSAGAVSVRGLETGVAAITAGSDHSCALLLTGHVRCWGKNTSAQLGDGTRTGDPQQIVPAPVVSLSSGVSSMSAGLYHTCAVTTAGDAKCWGGNRYRGRFTLQTGAIGDGTYLDRVAPVDVLGLQGSAQMIGAGYAHTCAVTNAGAAMCWGSNEGGPLGDGSPPSVYSQPAPVSVIGLSTGGQAVAGGNGFSCAIASGGVVYCWGSAFGAYRANPSPVPGLPAGIVQLALGQGHACARTSDGVLYCWGDNTYGQLGDGTTTNRNVPAPVSLGRGGASVVTAVAAGGSHTCAVTFDGAAKCWGANDHGQLGDNSTQDRAQPVDVVGLSSGAIAISAGSLHTCALLVTGELKCWGANSYGQLGDGSTVDRLVPMIVAGNNLFASVAAGDLFHTCAVNRARGAMCWGANDAGQLGIGFAVVPGSHILPVAVLGGFELQVEVTGTGAGSVSSNPSGIDCGTACSIVVEPGTQPPTLTATAVAGSVFTGWSGGGCSGFDPCTPQLAGATTVRANFAIQSPIPRLANISTRLPVQTGEGVAIAGFVIGGPVAKKVIVVARGPSLAQYGIANSLWNPTLKLVRSSDQTVVAFNDDWESAANAAEVRATGFAPSYPLESAIVATLDPGAYTAIVSGAGDSTGVAIVEVYELDHPEVPLLNISTRGSVLGGSDLMIGGFIIQGDAAQTVVVTAKGPSLAAYQIANPLSNPSLTLVRSSDQAVLATNDDWASGPDAAQISALGFAPKHPLESAILVTLAPGAYTAIVSGVGGATGVGIVEVYKVQQ